MSRPIPVLYKLDTLILRLPMNWFTRPHWRGARFFPKEGGFIVAANHVCGLDSMSLLHFLVGQGLPAKILVKEELLHAPIIGPMLRGAGMIPVVRDKDKAADSLEHAARALEEGEVVCIFPEGTLTRQEDEWPMKAKTGVARLALRTGAPVIPVAQWGMGKIMPRYSKRIQLLPRQDVWVSAGPAVDLSAWAGQQDDHEALTQATAKVMADITGLLEQIRGEKAPLPVFDRDEHPELPKSRLAEISQAKYDLARRHAKEQALQIEARYA